MIHFFFQIPEVVFLDVDQKKLSVHEEATHVIILYLKRQMFTLKSILEGVCFVGGSVSSQSCGRRVGSRSNPSLHKLRCGQIG